jgi:histidinol-phosphate aminotransferase
MTGLRARPALTELRAYNVDAPDCPINLADNTSAGGAPPAALDAARAVAANDVARYPTTFSRPLREAIAAYIGVEPDEVIVGCGSGDLIDSALRTFAAPGARVAHVSPTFIMARTFAITNGLTPAAVPLTEDWDANADALLSARADVTYLCSPNNPTGRCHSAPVIERVLQGAPGLLLLDEAYAEYSGRSHAAHAPAHGRLLVLRTFSKAFGLAGLRIGYAVGAMSLIAEMEKVRGPYKVTAVGEAAALAALTHDLAWMRRTAAETVRARDAFSAALRAAGREPLPSDANFVLVPVEDAARAGDALRARGIHVRAFPALPGTGDALRISIGPADVMQHVLAALLEVA